MYMYIFIFMIYIYIYIYIYLCVYTYCMCMCTYVYIYINTFCIHILGAHDIFTLGALGQGSETPAHQGVKGQQLPGRPRLARL